MVNLSLVTETPALPDIFFRLLEEDCQFFFDEFGRHPRKTFSLPERLTSRVFPQDLTCFLGNKTETMEGSWYGNQCLICSQVCLREVPVFPFFLSVECYLVINTAPR